MAQVWHPDKHSHNDNLHAKATNKIKEINAAWSEVEACFKNGATKEPLIYMDPLNSLMWTKNGNIAGRAMNWQDALHWVNNLNYGGYSDWRLPTIQEFVALSKQFGSSFDNWSFSWLTSNGFNSFQLDHYWSSSTEGLNTFGATVINMRDGFLCTNNKTNNYYVWPVRDGQFDNDATRAAESRAQKERETAERVEQERQQREASERAKRVKPKQSSDIPIFIDPLSGLMWTTNGNISGKKMNWHDAMLWANNLNYCGYNDWRLPSNDEFDAFVKSVGDDPSGWLNANGFKNVQALFYWSSSTNSADGADFVNMTDGGVYPVLKSVDVFAWPVRDGHFNNSVTKESEVREAEQKAREWLQQNRYNLPTYTDSKSSVLLRPLEQQTLGEKILRGLIGGAILVFLMRQCS